MVAHPGQILQPHSLLPLRQRECRKCAQGWTSVDKGGKSPFPTNIYRNQMNLIVRSMPEASTRKGISHLWKSRSTVNVQLCSRLKAAAKTQISRGCKLQDASKSSNLALMSVIEKLSPVSFESNISQFGFDSNSSFFCLLTPEGTLWCSTPSSYLQLECRKCYCARSTESGCLQMPRRHMSNLNTLEVCFKFVWPMQVKGNYNAITLRRQ